MHWENEFSLIAFPPTFARQQAHIIGPSCRQKAEEANAAEDYAMHAAQPGMRVPGRCGMSLPCQLLLLPAMAHDIYERQRTDEDASKKMPPLSPPLFTHLLLFCKSSQFSLHFCLSHVSQWRQGCTVLACQKCPKRRDTIRN